MMREPEGREMGEYRRGKPKREATEGGNNTAVWKAGLKEVRKSGT